MVYLFDFWKIYRCKVLIYSCLIFNLFRLGLDRGPRIVRKMWILRIFCYDFFRCLRVRFRRVCCWVRVGLVDLCRVILVYLCMLLGIFFIALLLCTPNQHYSDYSRAHRNSENTSPKMQSHQYQISNISAPHTIPYHSHNTSLSSIIRCWDIDKTH